MIRPPRYTSTLWNSPSWPWGWVEARRRKRASRSSPETHILRTISWETSLWIPWKGYNKSSTRRLHLQNQTVPNPIARPTTLVTEPSTQVVVTTVESTLKRPSLWRTRTRSSISERGPNMVRDPSHPIGFLGRLLGPPPINSRWVVSKGHIMERAVTHPSSSSAPTTNLPSPHRRRRWI